MTRIRTMVLGFAAVLIVAAAFGLAAQDKPAAPPAPAGPRPLALLDILAWKSIGAAELSPDGNWFMYRLSPLEGESEVVLREVKGAK
ncbi:MAG TPA: hypothetical protein VLJ16_05010, partial [Acidobacteriota bacterium]|nr:hypothetical protein [Acidobacteriota bacterium]